MLLVFLAPLRNLLPLSSKFKFETPLGTIWVCRLSGDRRSKRLALNWLQERVLTKFEGLKGNLLYQAGKEVLIKSVVQAIPNYIMSRGVRWFG